MLIAKQQASSISFFMNLLQFAARLLPEGKKQPEEEQKKDEQMEVRNDGKVNHPKGCQLPHDR